MSYTSKIKIPVESKKIFSFFFDIERLLRLNPQWAILSIDSDISLIKGSQFKLNIRYDRSDQEIQYMAIIEELIMGELLTIRLNSDVMPRKFTIKVNNEGNTATVVHEEIRDEEISQEEKREINLWLKCIANYIMILEKKGIFSKLWRYFLDKIWLRMSPMGRRIVLIIVLMEFLALIFFIFILIYLLIFKGL